MLRKIKAINHLHFNIGIWPAILFFGGVVTGVWKISAIAQVYVEKFDRLDAYVVEHSQKDSKVYAALPMIDSLKNGVLNDVKQRVEMKKDISFLMEAIKPGQTGVGFYTERKLRGRIIFERVQVSTK